MAIERVSIKEQVYQYIHDQIFNKELKPGSILRVANLSRELQVSNTPLREALSMLDNEGLIHFNSNGTYQVVSMDEDALQLLNGAIVSLLIGCVQHARSHNQLEKLIKSLEIALREQKSIPENASPLVRYQKAIAFDRKIAEATENRILINTFERMETILYLCTSLVDGKSDNSIEEHTEILEAIRKNDLNQIIQALERHYDKHLMPE